MEYIVVALSGIASIPLIWLGLGIVDAWKNPAPVTFSRI